MGHCAWVLFESKATSIQFPCFILVATFSLSSLSKKIYMYCSNIMSTTLHTYVTHVCSQTYSRLCLLLLMTITSITKRRTTIITIPTGKPTIKPREALEVDSAEVTSIESKVSVGHISNLVVIQKLYLQTNGITRMQIYLILIWNICRE